MKASLLTLMALSALVVVSLPSAAVTIDVPDDQPTIQAGIDAASYGDTVLVACGTYYEHDVEMKSGICLLSETGLPECVTIDAQQQGRVLYCDGVDNQASIAGFTITDGLAAGDSPPGNRGGGIFCQYSSPTVTNCTFSANAADGEGGGLFCRDDAYPEVSDCTFSENSAENGAGLYCADSSYASLTNCAFTSNTASGGGGAAYCAAPSSALVFADCRFSDNNARSGGGIFYGDCWGSLTDCLFLDNNASVSGGAIDCDYWTTIYLTSCAFLRNTALVSGGGVYLGGHCSASLTSCTFSENAANHGGGMYCYFDNSPVVTRSVIAFNTGGEAFFCDDGCNFPTLSCCDIYGNAGGDWVGCIADQYGVNGNFSADPLFCGDLNADEPYALHVDSPCAPDNNPECGLIGAWGVACGLTAVEPMSWGAIKAMFR